MTQIRDTIYNTIEVEPFAVAIINQPQFQRLRHVRQCGPLYLVYPSANHTRFEHSLGVYHLTKIALDHLNQQLPGKLSERVLKIVKIAALVHDIGHGPFSHLFEEILEQNDILIGGQKVTHEEVGGDVFRKMMNNIQDDIGLNDHDINCVCCLMLGQEPQDQIFQKYFFLNQIVSNSVNGLDTDKMDYLLRDSKSVGLGLTIDPIRILKNQSIFKYPNDRTGKYYLSSSHKTKFDIMQVYQSRYILNKIMYQTSKVIAWDQVIMTIFQEAIVNKIINVEDLYSKDVLPDDRILSYIQNTHENLGSPYAKLNNAINMLVNHKTPKIIFESSVTKVCELTSNKSAVLRANIIKQFIFDDTKIDCDQFQVFISDIKYGVKNQNPLDFLPIHNKNTVFTPTKFVEKYSNQEISPCCTQSSIMLPQTPARDLLPVAIDNQATQDMLIPNVFKETLLIIFVYDNKEAVVSHIKSSVQKFLIKNDLDYGQNSLQLQTESILSSQDLVPMQVSPMCRTSTFPRAEDFKFDDQ